MQIEIGEPVRADDDDRAVGGDLRSRIVVAGKNESESEEEITCEGEARGKVQARISTCPASVRLKACSCFCMGSMCLSTSFSLVTARWEKPWVDSE